MKRFIGLIAIATLGTASATQAQSWDAPSFMPPRPGADLGAYLVVGNDIGLRGMWRQTDGNLGLRLGYLDAGDGLIQAGAETWGDIVLEGADFPLDIVWTAGLGVAAGGGTSISAPAGVSLGRTVEVSSLTMQIYGHPRLVLAAAVAGGNVGLALDGHFDLGADVYLSEGTTFRIGVSLGGGDALGVGVAWRQ